MLEEAPLVPGEPSQRPLELVTLSARSGAELEQVVVSALYSAFSNGGELTDDVLEAEIKGTRPLSVLMAERMEELREWASGRCVPAD